MATQTLINLDRTKGHVFGSERERGVRFEFLDLLRSVSVVTFFSEEVYYRRRLDLRRRYLRRYHFQICSHAPPHGFSCSSYSLRNYYRYCCSSSMLLHGSFLLLLSPVAPVCPKENKYNRFFYCSLFIHISRGYGVVRELERGLMSKQSSCW